MAAPSPPLSPPLSISARRWLASAAPALACSPFDVVRSRLMATADGGIASHARAVMAEHGWRGFLRGADVTVLKAFPTNAAGFLALSQAKRLLDVEDR